MTLFYIVVGVLVLFILSAALAAFEQCLLSLRYRLLLESELDEAERFRGMSYVLARSESIVRAVRMMQGAFYIAFGVLVYLLVRLLWEMEVEVHPLRLVLALLLAFLAHYLVVFIVSHLLVSYAPVRTLKATTWLVIVLDLAWRPFVGLLARLEKPLLKKSRKPDTGILDAFDTEIQIRALAREDLALKPVMRNILRNGLRMSRLEVSDVLLPRNQIQYFDLNDPLEENLRIARETGHTRFPLCNGDLDHCIGLVHIKDLFRQGSRVESLDLRRVRRNIISVSVDDPIDEALQRLLRRKMHMALVTDDFGGTVGVVTLESILEELVGDIQDEFDVEEALIRQIGQDRYRVSGLAPVHDVEETLQVIIENDEVSTFGGLITSELGSIPDQGEELELEGGRLRVLVDEVDEKRVISTVVEVLALPEEGEEDAGESGGST